MIEHPQRRYPRLIVGGMGVYASSAELVKAAVSVREKEVMGVVAGTGLTVIMVNRLQDGDPQIKQALEAFCMPEMAEKIFSKYTPKAKALNGGHYLLPPKPETLINGSEEKKLELQKLLVLASFAEVWLARQGHNGEVGYNVLEKVQIPHLWELYGAVLGGANCVFMGAGMPYQMPDVLKRLANNEEASYRINVAGLKETYETTFNPVDLIPEKYLKQNIRPEFMAIVSHDLLAKRLADKSEVNGFVVEGPKAGGHNAPARGREVNSEGEPIYGERDEPDLNAIAKLGPFWLAGGYAGKLNEAIKLGAVGIQVGSWFALCNESGLGEIYKKTALKGITEGSIKVITSKVASPSGYPFNIAQLEHTLANRDVYNARRRVCGHGFLVHPYLKQDGEIGFRCPGGPVDVYVRKGGKIEDTKDKQCLCTGLIAATKFGEGPAILTLGKDVMERNDTNFIYKIKRRPDGSYSAGDVVDAIFKT